MKPQYSIPKKDRCPKCGSSNVIWGQGEPGRWEGDCQDCDNIWEPKEVMF